MKVRCPTCGKNISFPASDAGLLAVCSACGTKYRVPESRPESPPEADPESAPESAPEPAPDFYVASYAPPTARPRAAGSQAGRGVLWFGLALFAFVVTMAVVLALHERRRVWHDQTFAKAAQLKAEAESLAESQAWREARSRFGELNRFLAQQDDLPPDLRQLSDEAHQEEANLDQAEREHADAMTRRLAALKASPPAPIAQAVETSPVPQQSADSAGQPNEPPDSTPTSAPAQTRPGELSPSTAPALTRPPVQPVALFSNRLTDAELGQAIKNGVDHLLQEFNPTTHLLRGAENNEGQSRGLDILCVYALMQCQQATNDPRLNPHEELMKGLIDAMKRLPLDNYHWETYARGLRATALALYDREEDRAVLKQDALALRRGNRLGAYTYTLAHHSSYGYDEQRWDNSNSQYGLLGVWSAAEVAIEIPIDYWELVQRHWIRTQCDNGQWNYGAGNFAATHSMTCAGLASLFVTHDYLDAARFGGDVGREPFTRPLAKGLSWLEQGDNSVQLDRGAYDLYGLERVGLASGFKYFGTHDWFLELAAQAIADQQPDGSWKDDVETAYSLLFLARGRHPVLMNKVRFDGYWANRPRDAANLARFVGHQLERPLNWQVVPLARPWTDWMDSPILYLASHKAPKLSDQDYENIRLFVENGGLLFMQADGGSEEFDRFAHDAVHRLFPQYEMTDLLPTHPLCSVFYKITPPTTLKIVSNGSRILMLYSSDDLSKYWQLRDDKHMPLPFQIGTNLFIYAAGKGDLRNRLESSYIPTIDQTPLKTYTIARLKYPGNWNPEPQAWPRFTRWFQLNTGYALNVIEVPIADLKPETAPIAQLTGTARYDLTAREAEAIKNYVESGGVLLVDLCGGTGAFDKGLQSSLFFNAFGGNPSHVMSPADPLLTASGNGMDDLSRPRLRPYAIDLLGVHAGLPEEIAAGKGHIIFTPLDLTTGLLGTGTWGIVGYAPNYAQAFVKNAILWTLDGQPEQRPIAKQ